MATVVTMGGVSFTISGNYSWGLDEAGVAWVAIPTGTDTITSITPSQTTDSNGDLINGAMLNPARGATSGPNQGFDERQGNYDAGSVATLPITIQAGDIVIKTVAKDPYVHRAGGFTEIASLHVLSSTLPSGEYLGSSIGWSGKSTPVSYSADVDSWYSSRPVYNSTGFSLPPYADLMESLGQHYPLFGFAWGPGDYGYQSFSPYRFGGGNATHPNYGRYIGQMMSLVMVALATNYYTEAQTKQIAKTMIGHGLQWADPLIFSGTGVVPDGGHYQWHQPAVLFALHLTGRSSEYSDFMALSPGNWDQAFQITQALIDSDFSPHSSTIKPSMWRERTLPAQPGGSTLRIPIAGTSSSGDYYQTNIPEGAIATRVSDGETGVVSTTYALNDAGQTLTTLDVVLNDTSPFAEGDVIYFDAPSGWMNVGDFDWALRGGFANLVGQPWKYSPSAQNAYRGLQAWAGAIFALYAIGIRDPSIFPVLGYTYRAEKINIPSAANDFPSIVQSWQTVAGSTYTASSDFYNAYADDVYSSEVTRDLYILRSSSASIALLSQ